MLGCIQRFWAFPPPTLKNRFCSRLFNLTTRSNNPFIKITLYVTNCTFRYQMKAEFMTNTIKFISYQFFEYLRFYKQNSEGTLCDRNWRKISSKIFAIFFSKAFKFDTITNIIHKKREHICSFHLISHMGLPSNNRLRLGTLNDDGPAPLLDLQLMSMGVVNEVFISNILFVTFLHDFFILFYIMRHYS